MRDSALLLSHVGWIFLQEKMSRFRSIGKLFATNLQGICYDECAKKR